MNPRGKSIEATLTITASHCDLETFASVANAIEGAIREARLQGFFNVRGLGGVSASVHEAHVIPDTDPPPA